MPCRDLILKPVLMILKIIDIQSVGSRGFHWIRVCLWTIHLHSSSSDNWLNSLLINVLYYCIVIVLLLMVIDFNSAWIISNAGIFNRTDGHRIKLFEESVTFIAQLQNEVTIISIISFLILI